jgi:hypothetical protein
MMKELIIWFERMESKNKVMIGAIAVVVALVIGYFSFGKDLLRRQNVKPIEITRDGSSEVPQAPVNDGPISPITGVACENWNKRAFAVMQPVDRQARPVAGFSQADMVFEMPNPAEGIFVTRLLGVYQCEIPDEVGAMRSARHDYISVARGLDAIFVGWGGSAFALKKLDDGVIDNLDCNDQGGKRASQFCFRKERTGLMRGEDTGYIKGDQLLAAAKNYGYRETSNFSGYPHQEDAPVADRVASGHLRFGYPGMMEAEYDYDSVSNSYLRIWGGEPDFDRNNDKRIAPKNVVLVIAENEQIMATTDYKARGVSDPWEGLEDWEKEGPRNISGRYNNLQFGDPWFDTAETGEARYYMNGKEYRGTWKKSRKALDSKLFFYDESGSEIKFVPGQIWVEVMVPGMAFGWEPQA